MLKNVKLVVIITQIIISLIFISWAYFELSMHLKFLVPSLVATYLSLTGNSSLVEMMSSAFQPNVAMPEKKQERMTIFVSECGRIRIMNALTAHRHKDATTIEVREEIELRYGDYYRKKTYTDMFLEKY